MKAIKTNAVKIIGVALVFAIGAVWGSSLLTGCSSTPSASQLKQILEENPDILANAIKKNPNQIMEAINDAVQESRREQAEQAQKAQDAARAEERKNPKKPEIDEARVIFAKNDALKKEAPITIVEYADFQCGYCSRAHDTVEEIMDKYGDKVRVVYKHLPILGPQSVTTAHYYEAIALQDHKKAEEFHHKIFAEQGNLRSGGEDFLKKTAKAVGANLKKLDKDLASDKVKERVQADEAEGRKFGFSGTPAFLVNGVSLNGAQPLAAFEQEFRQQGLLD